MDRTAIVAFVAFGLGCALAPIAERSFTRYCCEAGTIERPRACRTLDASTPCTGETAFALECRDHHACSAGSESCFCCREPGETGCRPTYRSTKARPSAPDAEPARDPEPPPRRPEGTVWSPF